MIESKMVVTDVD